MTASHGLRRRYKPRQLELTFIGAIKQHFRSTNSLWPICFSVYASLILFVCCRKKNLFLWIRFSNPKLRHRRNTRYEWLAKPYPTRTSTLQDSTSFLVALTLNSKIQACSWPEYFAISGYVVFYCYTQNRYNQYQLVAYYKRTFSIL